MRRIVQLGPGGASNPELIEAAGSPHRSGAIPVSLTRPWQIAIVTTASVVFLFKILLALRTYGTNDVYTYERFFVWSQYLGVTLYRAAPEFNHPPSMIHILHVLGWLANATGLPFPFWLRLPGILADLGSLWIVWKVLGARAGERSISWALLLLAAAPPLILISGFHGNTDTIMLFFLLLSVYLIETGRSSWASGASFGLSVCIKVVPLMFIPVIFLYLANHRKRIEFFAATGTVLLLGWSPFIFQDPAYIIKQVFGYQSILGVWGLSYLLLELSRSTPGLDWLALGFWRFGGYLTLGLILLLSFWMNRSTKRPRLFSQVGIIFLFFLSLTNGFGVQYLSWLAPWVIELGAMPTAIFFVASGAFLFLEYNLWTQGLPWYLADANVIRDHRGLDYYQVVCWLSVVVVLWAAWKRMRIDTMAVAASILPTQRAGRREKAGKGKREFSQKKSDHSMPLRMPAVAWRLAFALFAAALVAYPIVREVPGLTRGFNKPASVGKDAIKKIRAYSYLRLSRQLYQLERFQDSIKAAKEAMKLYPDSPNAYTYMAGAYAALGMWDEAIENAREELRINPDSEAAKNNLAAVLRRGQVER